MADVIVTLTIDTEEDDWASYAPEARSSNNIRELPRLQEIFNRYGARPTYLVNRAPLLDPDAVEVLGALAEHAAVEVGAHCHPWNTPPIHEHSSSRTMMYTLPVKENRAKIAGVLNLLRSTLGVDPRSFRTGRWGFGPTVAQALFGEGILIDASVSPFIDWTPIGGPDFSAAPHAPYRFHPDRPLVAVEDGPMLQLPTTVGFTGSRDQVQAGRRRAALERSLLARFKAIGVLDRLGWLRRRWLSPETSSADELVRLADTWSGLGERVMSLTFHSCTLLPGATPFVRDADDQRRFLGAIETFVRHCASCGHRFATLEEVASEYSPGVA